MYIVWKTSRCTDLKKTPQAIYRNILVRSCNHCCSGKTISFTQSEGVFVA